MEVEDECWLDNVRIIYHSNCIPEYSKYSKYSSSYSKLILRKWYEIYDKEFFEIKVKKLQKWFRKYYPIYYEKKFQIVDETILITDLAKMIMKW